MLNYAHCPFNVELQADDEGLAEDLKELNKVGDTPLE